MKKLAVVTAAVAMTLGSAGTAHAGLLGSLGTTVKSTTSTTSSTLTGVVGQVLPPPITQAVNPLPPEGYDPLTPLEGLVEGTQGVGQTLEQLLCPPAEEVAELLALGGNPIGDGISSLACQASLLEYRFLTKFKRANGTEVVRVHNAILGLPTSLNVDDDAAGDLTGTITLTGLNTVGLRVQKSPLETTALPVQVEAILRDPSGGSLGREHIAFGFDSRMDRVPGTFTMSTPVNTILAPSPDFQLDITQATRGEKIALVGGIFDGTELTRINPSEVRLDYDRSPDTAGVRARVGDDISVTLTTNRPGRVVASGRIADAAGQDRFVATIADMPSSLNVTIAQGENVSATYGASARVANLDATLVREQFAGAVVDVLQKVELALDDVPTGLSAVVGDTGGNVSTTGGPLGVAQVGIADGDPRYLADAAYVNLDEDATLSSITARIPGIERIDFSIGDGATVSAKMASTPFRARIAEPGRTITADVLDLPAEFDLGLDIAGGVLSYDGKGEGIGKITLAGDSTTPFFGRATKLRGSIEGIPAKLVGTLETADGKGGFRLSDDSSGPIDKLELVASDGSEELPAGSGQGAIYRDITGGDFLVSARILGLREISFDSTSALAVRARTAGGPFDVELRTDDISADGSIRDLPADAAFAVDEAQGKFSFSGKDAAGDPAGIAILDLVASAPDGTLFGAADRIDVHVEDLPATLDLGLSPNRGDIDVTASDAIGLIEVIAANRAVDEVGDLPAGGAMGFNYIDKGGEFLVGARILGLRRVSAALGDVLDVEAVTAGGLFLADIQTPEIDGTASIDQLPAQARITADLDGGGMTFSGKDAAGNPDGIERFDVDIVSNAGPLFGRATHLSGHIEDIPAELSLGIAQSGGGVDFTANEPIGLIELVAANRAPQPDDLPAGGSQGAKFTDLTGGDFVVAARVRELKRLAASVAGDVVNVATETAGGPFGVRLRNDELDAVANILDLPSTLSASVNLPGGKIEVHGSQPINLITFDAQSTGPDPVFGAARFLHARIAGVPQDVLMDLAQDGTGARLTANPAIGSIEVAASDDPVDIDTVLPAGHRATYIDKPGDFLLAARVEQLRLLDVRMDPTIAVQAQMAPGQFDVFVDTETLDATGTFKDLPDDVSIGVNPADGQFSYTGSATIDEVRLGVSSTQPLFGRATRFDVEIDKLPQQVTLNLAQDGAGGAVTTSAPIERLQVSASDGAPVDVAALLSQPQGAVFHDTPAEFVLAARLLDLKSLSFGLTGESVGLTSELRSTPFVVDIASGAVDAAATITNLPEKTALSLNLDQGTLHFEGKDANDAPKPIGSITFEADAPASDPLFGSARKIRGAIVGVPAVLDVAFNQTGGTASLDANGGQIGEIAFIASSDPAAVLPGNDPGTPHDDQGVTFRDRGGAFEVAARVLGLRSLSATLGNGLAGGPVVLDAKTAGGIFDLDVATDDFVADGVIDKLPSDVTVTVDLDSGDVRFLGNTGIDRVALNANADTPLVGRADKLDVLLEGLPADVAVKLSQTQGTAEVTSRDSGGAFASIDRIEVAAWNDSKELPAGGAQGAVYRDVNPAGGGSFRIGARILELEQLKVDFLDAVQLVTRTAGGPFSAVVQTADLTGNVQINDLPTVLTLGVDLDAGAVTYSGSSTIASIVASLESATPLFGNAKAFKVGLTGVPQAFTIVASPSVSNQISLKATQGTIGKIEVQAGPSLTTLPAFPTTVAGTAVGVNDAGAFADLTGGKFELAARVFNLNELTVDLDPMKITSKMATGRKFFVDAKIPSGASTIDADALIDQLPSDVTIELANRTDGSGGKDIKYTTNAVVNRLYLKATGITLFPGANTVEAEITGIPTAFTLALPETGALAVLSVPGNQTIGQIRLRAGDVLSLPSGAGNDVVRYRDSPTTGFGLAGQFTGIRGLSVNLEPIALTLNFDPAAIRRLDLDAVLRMAGASVNTNLTGFVANPAPTTSLSVNTTGGTRINLDNSAAIGAVNLNATNLGSIPTVNATLSNVSRKLAVCFDSGTGCERPLPGGYNARRVTSTISVSADQQGTGGGTPTELDAAVRLSPGEDPITITDLRFFNLGIDAGFRKYGGGDYDQEGHVFLDTAGTTVTGKVRYPDAGIGDGIEADLRSGTHTVSGQPRLVNFRLDTDCFLGACIPDVEVSQRHGNLQCGSGTFIGIRDVFLGTDLNLANPGFPYNLIANSLQLCNNEP